MFTKNFFLLFIYITTTTILSAMEDCEVDIIPQASYCVCNGDDAYNVLTFSLRVHGFYTFDGNRIPYATNHLSYRAASAMLDPLAPKPQPTCCFIKHILTEYGQEWLIIFCDKHGHRIRMYHYDRDNGHIVTGPEKNRYNTYVFNESTPTIIDQEFPLDLSNVKNVTVETPITKAKPRCAIS